VSRMLASIVSAGSAMRTRPSMFLERGPESGRRESNPHDQLWKIGGAVSVVSCEIVCPGRAVAIARESP
jgi:hypothetical protein